MATTPQRPAGITGVIRIVRQARERDRVRPFDYRISFGGSKAPTGALYLGKAFRIEDLIHLLTRIGVSGAEAEMAAQALTDHPEYEISGVTLRPGTASSRGQVRRYRQKALHDTDKADGREQSLYLKVCERLERGTLGQAPNMVRVGKATRERTCIICEQVIRRSQVLNESVTDDGTQEFTHTLCLRVWVDVSRFPKGREGVK